MKVILRKNIDKLGKAGDILVVKDGYARNYLLPKELVYLAKEHIIKRIELSNKNRSQSVDKIKADAMELAAKLNDLQITIPMKVGEMNKLYGSVNTNVIAAKLAELGYNIEKNNIILDEAIKTLGIFDMPIKLHNDVIANLKV